MGRKGGGGESLGYTKRYIWRGKGRVILSITRDWNYYNKVWLKVSSLPKSNKCKLLRQVEKDNYISTTDIP